MIEKIAFIIPSIGVGGAERVVVSLAQALSLHYKCVILVQSNSDKHYHVDVEVIEISFTYKDIMNTVQEQRIDLVLDHFHWEIEHVKVLAKVADAGIPVILTEHNTYYYPLFQHARDNKAGYDQWFTDRYDIYKHFAGVTLLNSDTYRLFRQHLDNIRIVPNPVPYIPAGQGNYTSKRILSASHFYKKAKRIDLLYAMQSRLQAKVPKSELVIMGNYSWVQDQYYRKATGCHSSSIICSGRTRLVENYYYNAALFAMTSEIEGQPMVLLEAAMHGLPQICFDIPGMRDQIVDGVTGHLIPYGNIEAFADCAASMLGNPKQLAKMGAEACEFVKEKFSVEHVTSTWLSLIAEIEQHGRLISSDGDKLSLEEIRKDEEWTSYWNLAIRKAIGPVNPKLSFLVPVYGTEALLGRCLRSIQDQTLTEFECLVVDDASPGNVEAAVHEAVGNDARFRLIHHKQNRGLYQARSTAAAEARGIYFANIDSDDYVHPQFAEILFEKAIVTDSEIVECQAIELHPDGRPIRFNEIKQTEPIDGKEAVNALINNNLRHVVWNKIYSRDLWQRVPEHNEFDVGLSITEDLMRNSFLFPACRRYSAVKDCLYYYCRRPTSVVTGGGIERLKRKLRDIDFSYEKAKSRFTAPSDSVAQQKLEVRRIEDIKWYIREYLKRHSKEEIQYNLANADISPSLALTISLIMEITYLDSEVIRLGEELRERWDGWKWELDRASRLEKKLDQIINIAN